ncbi:putative bifunctional diguanylate cyclase/phosphodiesterase [Azospirillum thermophilum]|nr:EAL domain-containing protein [Azospirillum thermophilum]
MDNQTDPLPFDMTLPGLRSVPTDEALALAAFRRILSSACIIDSCGVIILTNDAWDHFGGDGRPTAEPCFGRGENYLDVCARAAGGGDPHAAAVLERLEAVLKGLLREFTLEYPCQTSTDLLWFSIEVAAFTHEGERWAVVIHNDISAHVSNEAALSRANSALDGVAQDRLAAAQRAEQRSALLEMMSSDGVWDWLPDSDDFFASDRLTEILGGPRIETGRAFFSRLHLDDADRLQPVIALRLRIGGPFETEARFLRPDGSEVWVLLRGNALPGNGLAPARVVGTLCDISVRREAEESLKAGVARDSLTGLLTRTVFMDRLTQALRHAGAMPVSLLLADLDGLSDVNQRFGGQTGNALLREIAWRICEEAGPGATVARIGGDVFTILLPDTPGEAAQALAERLRARIADPIRLGPDLEVVTASFGVVTAEPGPAGPGQPEVDPEEMVVEAELGMLAAKGEGGDRCRTFEPEMRRTSLHRNRLASSMREALAVADQGDPDGFYLVYQPIHRLSEERPIAGYEALLRWQSPILGAVSPADFIPVAERAGLIVPLGDWVMRRACRQLAAWLSISEADPDLFVGVNVAPQQLYQPDFVDKVLACLDSTGLAPHNLKIEVTEGSILDNAYVAANVLNALRAQGVRLSIDDFGTGFSSLSYLANFQFSELKIDRSFVQGMIANPRTREVVKTIVTLGQGLGMSVVAEGVERSEELALLEAIGCHLVQGYLLGRPMGPDQILPPLRAELVCG